MSEIRPPEAALADFIARARWFGGKGRDFTVTGAQSIELSEPAAVPRVVISLVTVRFEDGTEDLYQVPLSAYATSQERLSHARVAEVEGLHLYDAVHDREAMAQWLGAFAAAPAQGSSHSVTPGRSGLAFHRTGSHEFDLSAYSTLFSGEQSNSSVAFGDQSLMKVFRRLTPGVNPDIEIHRALTEAGGDVIAELHGWLDLVLETPEGPAPDEPLQLAMLQEFLRTASDGWDLALASVRNLFAEADLLADEVGGDFAGESHRLGAVVARAHAALRGAFGEGTVAASELAERMHARLEASARHIPELADHTDTAAAAFAVLRDTAGEVPTQRVHGDLHLGQTLRTVTGWKLVDFEGEPAKPLAERRLADSPWRDVAGMLRSFDYAVQSVARDLGTTGDAATQVAYRAAEWQDRNRAAFLDGYAEERGHPLDAVERALVIAYETDKAVYEVHYEARNRPDWIGIPLGALDRLGRETGPSHPPTTLPPNGDPQ